jgi:hypothetical protein
MRRDVTTSDVDQHKAADCIRYFLFVAEGERSLQNNLQKFIK